MITCALEGCGKQFESYRSRQLYCSPRCQHNAKARRQYRSSKRYQWLEAHKEELAERDRRYKRIKRRRLQRSRLATQRHQAARVTSIAIMDEETLALECAPTLAEWKRGRGYDPSTRTYEGG